MAPCFPEVDMQAWWAPSFPEDEGCSGWYIQKADMARPCYPEAEDGVDTYVA